MKRGKKLSADMIELIKELRKKGYKISYICKELSVNKNTVLKYSKEES